MECSQDTDTPLPILSHINANTLNLANYTLSSGHCKALKRASQFLQTNINRVRFNNCGIDDGEMANLLQAFCQFKDFKSIIYRQNELNEESLEWLRRLLAKGIPYHLQELRISDCRLTPHVTSELIKALAQKSFLKQFELRNAALSCEDVQRLGDYVIHSKQIEELDLSYNGMMPNLVDVLLEKLVSSKRLVSLNLAQNSLIEGNTGANQKRKLESEARAKNWLTIFIGGSKKLIHLDLTKTSLSEEAILFILPTIKSSKNLQGVHLSGNPGVTDAVRERVTALLRVKPPVQRRSVNIVKLLSPQTQERYKT